MSLFADVLARSSIVFGNSVCADRIVMAASRLLGAAAARVILLSFAAGHRKSYWNGCIKAAIVICHAIFVNFDAGDLPFKIPFKIASKFKIFFFALASRTHPILELQVSDAVARSCSVFYNSPCADRIVINDCVKDCPSQLDIDTCIGMDASSLR